MRRQHQKHAVAFLVLKLCLFGAISESKQQPRFLEINNEVNRPQDERNYKGASGRRQKRRRLHNMYSSASSSGSYTMDSASRRHHYNVQEEKTSLGLLWNNELLNRVFQAEANKNSGKTVQVAVGVLGSGHRNKFDDFGLIFSGDNSRLFDNASKSGGKGLRCIRKGYVSSSSSSNDSGKGNRGSKSIKKLSKREVDWCYDNDTTSSSTSSSYRSRHYKPPLDPPTTPTPWPILTRQPSSTPSTDPSTDPSLVPTDNPTAPPVPTPSPSMRPSTQASNSPSSSPSSSPSLRPSVSPSSVPSTEPSSCGQNQPRFEDYAIYFDDTIENPYSLRRYLNSNDGDSGVYDYDVFYRSFGCREGSTTDLGMLFWNTENCQVECEFTVSQVSFQEMCTQRPDRIIRFELPVGAFPTDTPFYVGNLAPDSQLTCAQAIPMRACELQKFNFIADYFENTADLQYKQVVPPETDTGFSEVFSCEDAGSALNDGGVVQFNNDACEAECVGTIPQDRIRAFCLDNFEAEFSLFIPGEFSSDSRVYVGILSDDFDLPCYNLLTITAIATAEPAAAPSTLPAAAPSALPSSSLSPTSCNVPRLDDYSIFFEETVEDPFALRTVQKDGNDDGVYHRILGCREGASTDIGMLFFDEDACRVECIYYLSSASYRDLCRQTPDRNVRFELPVGDYSPGTTFVVGYLSEASTLSCANEVFLRSCSNQGFDFFAQYFATGDDTYRRVFTPQTEDGFHQTISCEDLGDTDLGVIQFNNDLCSTDCLGYAALSKALKLCNDDVGGDVSLFIPGSFTSDDRLYIGSLNYDSGLQCAAEFEVSVVDSNAPSLMPSSTPSMSSNPTRCAVPAFDEYAIYFDGRLNDPYRGSRVPLDHERDYIRAMPCQEGISTDFIVLYFDDEKCQNECKYVLPYEAFDRVCIERPDRGIRAVLPGGDLPAGSRIYIGFAAVDFALTCAQEIPMQPCGNHNYQFFAPFFDDTIDDSYQRFGTGDTDSGIERTYTCRTDATTDIGILLYNTAKCSTVCLYTIPYSAFGNRCKENPGEQFSYFIPGQFNSAQRMLTGNVAKDFNLNCGETLSIQFGDEGTEPPPTGEEFHTGRSHGLLPGWLGL